MSRLLKSVEVGFSELTPKKKRASNKQKIEENGNKNKKKWKREKKQGRIHD